VWVIDARSDLIGIPEHKAQKKMSVREPFPPLLYCGRTLIHQKGEASGQKARHSAMLFPSFSLAFLFFSGNGDSSGIAHRLLDRYQHAIAIDIHESSKRATPLSETK
jgi:hypothetical protein